MTYQSNSLRLFVAIVLLSCPAYAQRDRDNYVGGITFEVSGEVRLPPGGPPTRDVTVRLERFSGGIVDQMQTDGRSKFRFANLQRGYYTIFVEAPGYKQSRQQADLQVVTRLFVVFELTPDDKDSIPGIEASVIDARVPLDAQAEFAKGRTALSDKRPKEARQHLQKAIEFYPNFFEAQILLASIHVDAYQWQDAEVALQRALEIRPESAEALISLGEVKRRQKNFQDAEKYLLDGLKIEENSSRGHFTLARVYWDATDVLKAAPHVGRAIQLKPDYADAHLLAGNIFVRLKLLERAIVEYDEYLRLAPKGEAAGQTRELVAKIKKTLAARQE